MAITVLIPAPLRRLTRGQSQVSVEGGSLSLRQGLERLEDEYPGLKEKICDAEGGVHRYVNVYVNGEDIRFLGGLEASLKDGDRVSIVPAIAGGS